MKIMLVGAESDIASGAFRCLAEMAKYLNDIGNEVIVVLPEKGNGENLLNEYKIRYKIVKNYGSVGNNNFKTKIKFFIKNMINKLVLKKSVDKLLQAEKPDIIHVNSAFTYLFGYSAYKLSIPYTWHLRDDLEEGHNCSWLNKKMIINLINNSKRIITVSDCIYDKYKNILDESRMLRVYDGIDINKFYHKKQVFNERINKFLFVGGLWKNKGQIEIVRYLSEIYKEGLINNFTMKIAGGGSEKVLSELMDVIKHNEMSNIIQYVGKQENVEDLYKDADVVFMNSYMEAFGRVTAEGMASGCLVVGANRGGTKEILSDNCGVLYEYGNKESFKAAILKVLAQKEEMKAIAKRGQEKAIEMFDSKKNATIMNDIFAHEVNEWRKNVK